MVTLPVVIFRPRQGMLRFGVLLPRVNRRRLLGGPPAHTPAGIESADCDSAKQILRNLCIGGWPGECYSSAAGPDLAVALLHRLSSMKWSNKCKESFWRLVHDGIPTAARCFQRACMPFRQEGMSSRAYVLLSSYIQK